MNRTIHSAALSCGLAVLAVSVLTAAPSQAWAQVTGDCPADIPSSSRDRRPLAKEWFSRAEAAEAAGDPIGAAKAYQCSLRLVPHAFTAFNLGRLAERTGDLELAVESFNTYLKLAPEAQDKAEIEAKIAGLNERIASLRNEQQPTPPVVTTPPDPGPVTATPPLPDLTPPGTDRPTTAPTENPPGDDQPSGLVISPAAWAVAGVGVAALAGGIFLNMGARSKMDECRELAPVNYDSAVQSCDAAKPRAYASYALFGVAAAAAVADAVLLVMTNRDPQEPAVSLAPVPGGAVLGTRLRF